MSEYFVSPSSSPSSSSYDTSNGRSNDIIFNIDDDKRIDSDYYDDYNNAKSKGTRKYCKGDTNQVVGMINRTCPIGERKVLRKTYSHSQNHKDKNCEEPRSLLSHFDECQNLDCRDCMRLIGMCLSHHQ